MTKKTSYLLPNLCIKLFIVAFALFITNNLLAQTTYYVDATNGIDTNNGTSESTAWKTLSHVSAQTFSAGDNILLKKGETFIDKLEIVGSGTSAAPITLSSYGTAIAKPKIAVADPSAIYGVHINFRDYVIIENIEVTGEPRYGIWVVGGSNNIIQDCYVHHISVDDTWHGIMLNQTTSHLKILRNEISHCGLEGIYGSSEDIEIANNYIHNINMIGTVGDCIQLDLKAKRFHVHHNVFDRSMTPGGKGCVVCSDPSTDLNGIFEYNTVINAPNDNFGFSAPGFGCIVRYNTFKGVASSQFAVKGPHLIHHNIFDTYESAFDFGIASSDYKVYNNIFKNISENVIFIAGSINGDRYVDYEFKNNISDNSNFSVTSNGVAVRSHNIYTSGSISEPFSIVADPMFVSETDYHLQASSPAINRGTPVGLTFDFEGNPIDNDTLSIGIYEFTGEIDSTIVTDYPTNFNFNYEEQVIGKVVSTIDASGTTDINSISLAFNWIAPAEFVVKSLSDDVLSYIPPKVTEATSFPVILNVFDGYFWSADTIEVEVVPYNPYDQRLAVDTATASGYDADTRMPMTVLDDDIATRWAHEGDERWIMFELTEPALISYVEMAFFRGTSRQSYFDIQGSNDATNWTTLRAGVESCGFTADTEAFIDLGNDSLTLYKYIRILGHGNSSNSWNSYGTVHLYGIIDTEIHLDLDYDDEVAGLVASQMDASASFVKFREELAFSWELPEGFEAQGASSSVLNYLAPKVTEETDYKIVLTLSAGVKTLVDSIDLTVYPYNPEAGILLVDTAYASGYDLDSHMPMNVLDDDLSTRWSDEGDNKWIMLKLEYPSTLSHFEMSFFRGTSRYSIFDIYASEDSINWVPQLLDGESCGFTNNIEIIGSEGDASAYFNYVKVVGHGNSSNLWNSYNNLKPFGKVKVTAGDKDDYSSPKKFGQWYNDLKLHPNPANNHVNIMLREDAEVRILSLSGFVIYENFLSRGNTQYDVSSMAPGLYVVLARFQDGSLISKKLIVQ